MKAGWVFAIILAVVLVLFVIWLVSIQIEEFELQKDPKLTELKNLLRPMFSTGFNSPQLSKIKTNNILDKVGLYKGDKSYTINKSKVFLCLRDQNGNYYDNNTLVYVLLHEIAHVLCVEVDHTDLFQEILQELLNRASSMGLYDPKIPVVDNYCEN